MNKKTVRDIEVKDKRVLLRAALNVPIEDGKVVDAFRIESGLPTMQYVLEHGGSLLLLSHHSQKGMSLKPVAAVLEEKLGCSVRFIGDVLSDEAKTAAAGLKPGEVVLFENLRFHPEEEANDAGFARALAALGDVYVDDDFTVMHREHASVIGLPKYLPAVAGLQVEKEVDYISGTLERPNRPLAAVIGGAKVSTKIAVLRNLIPKVDVLMLGGAMANTFFLAQGHKVGRSLVEPELVKTATELLELSRRENCELLLPERVVVSEDLAAAKQVRTVALAEVGGRDYIVDVTPAFGRSLGKAMFEFLDMDHKCTVIWNGPLGLTEVAEFAAGTKALVETIAALPGVISIVGGGDTAGFVDGVGMHDKFTWVSTGGGASLQLMAGEPLPGLEALQDSRHGVACL